MIELAGCVSVNDRQDVLVRFLKQWYGDLHEGKHWASSPGCPPLLVWWHSLVLANPKLAGTQNRFDAPECVSIDPFVRYRGSTVEVQDARSLWFFYTENQGVVTWASESGDDPIVWAKSDWRPTHTDAWSPEAEMLSGFLIGAVLMEAMHGAEAGGAWTSMARSDFDRIQGLTNVGLAPSSAPNDQLNFWSGPDFIAVATPGEAASEVRVMFGSNSPEALVDIGELVDDPYDAGLWQ